MGFCDTSPQAMPSVVIVVCDTVDITARDLTWSAWGKAVSTAHGTAVVDLCAYSDCHTGAFTSTPIEVIASKIVHCGKHTRAYSTLRYVFPAGSPWKGTPTKMDTSGYISGPHRPLPPPNQTVRLTC
jgi:hypothetical protein